MLKWTTTPGEGRYLAVGTLPPWGTGLSECSAQDIVCALKANPEACAEVMRGLDENYDRSIGVVVRRAESAERSRDELREALTRIQTVVAPKLTKQLPVAGVANEVIRLHSDFMLMQRERDEARAERDRMAAELGAICVAATVRPEEDWCAVYGAATVAVHDLLAQRNTAIRERDALKAKLAEAERELLAWHTICDRAGFSHAPESGPWHVDAAARESFAEWCVTAARDAGEAIDLRAKLTEAEAIRERALDMTQAAERRAEAAEAKLAALSALIHTESGLDDHRYSAEQMVKEMAERWQGASDDCEKAEQALATVTGERDEARAERDAAVDRLVGARVARESAIEDAEALRARLAKTERVVGAARKAEKAAECRAKGCTCCANVVQSDVTAALRALDAPDGIIPCVIGPPLRFDSRGAFDDDDSPVEVAATACDHKRQRCENDHAVCRDCGAVNRAVTGVVDWGPPRNRPR